MKRIFGFFRKRSDLKNAIIERERSYASKQRLEIMQRHEREKTLLIEKHEKERRESIENVKKELYQEMKEKIREKNNEIKNLKRAIKDIQGYGENLQIISKEFELDLRGIAILAGKMQNRAGNIEHKTHVEIQKIGKTINKYLGEEEL